MFGEGLTSRIIRSGEALIINRETDRRGLELGAKVVGQQALSYLGVPIPVGGTSLGVISVQSTQTEGVYDADDQRLLSTIAANVGVALQNARLFNETQEALSHQTATADILRVISSSPTDVQPVFDAIVNTALRLLACDFTALLRCDGAHVHARSPTATPGGVPMELGERDRAGRPGGELPVARDLSQVDAAHPGLERDRASGARDGRSASATGVNSSLMLPLLRKDECIGVLVLARDKAGPFDDKEIALAKSFVDQAVIAIENVRLFNETKEALERQTATAEVLQVISESPTDVQPVFDTIAERAAQLTGAESGHGVPVRRRVDPPGELVRHRIRVHRRCSGRSCRRRSMLISYRPRRSARGSWSTCRTCSFARTPIRAAERNEGGGAQGRTARRALRSRCSATGRSSARSPCIAASRDCSPTTRSIC